LRFSKQYQFPTLNLSMDFFGRILLLHSTVTVSVFPEGFQMKRVTVIMAVLTAAVLLGSAQEQTEKTVTGWVLIDSLPNVT
jgi:hypothetical protein